MPIIRQESLFDLQDLYDLEPTQRFDALFSAIDIGPVLHQLSKKRVLAGLLSSTMQPWSILWLPGSLNESYSSKIW